MVAPQTPLNALLASKVQLQFDALGSSFVAIPKTWSEVRRRPPRSSCRCLGCRRKALPAQSKLLSFFRGILEGASRQSRKLPSPLFALMPFPLPASGFSRVSLVARRLPSLSSTAFRSTARIASATRLRPRLAVATSTSSLYFQARRPFTMDAAELTHYLADEPPSVVRLEIEKHFEPLDAKQKRYAHFISK